MSSNSRSVIKRSPNHVATDMAGEVVVLDMKSGMYYGMGDVAALIWNTIAEPTTFEAVTQAVQDAYEIDPAQCERDVTAFLAELETAGLVEITHEHPA